MVTAEADHHGQRRAGAGADERQRMLRGLSGSIQRLRGA